MSPAPANSLQVARLLGANGFGQELVGRMYTAATTATAPLLMADMIAQVTHRLLYERREKPPTEHDVIHLMNLLTGSGLASDYF